MPGYAVGRMGTFDVPAVATPAGLPRRFGAYFFDSVIITLAVAVVFYTVLGFDNALAQFLRAAPDDPERGCGSSRSGR